MKNLPTLPGLAHAGRTLNAEDRARVELRKSWANYPHGLLLERDELTGWLRSINREDRSNDRAFHIECFGGGGRYTYDRIGRGTLHIENTTLSPKKLK